MDRPDILVLEGLNVLQAGRRTDGTAPEVFLSDFFDFSVYVDAAEADIQRWYVERFLALRRTAFQDTTAYFHRFADLTDDQARETALGHLGGGQRAEPAQQHRADPLAGPAGPAEGQPTTPCAGCSSASSEPRPRHAVPTCAYARRVSAALAGPADSLG